MGNILSVPHNIVMSLNNVMGSHVEEVVQNLLIHMTWSKVDQSKVARIPRFDWYVVW